MAERRSLGQAMTMSPEKVAFIKGDASPKVSSPAVAPESAKPREEEGHEGSEPSPAKEVREERKVRVARRQERLRTVLHQPDANEILDRVLVSLTIRLPHRTAQALRRAYLEQRLAHSKPDTQQEIAQVAIGEWLSRHGFLD